MSRSAAREAKPPTPRPLDATLEELAAMLEETDVDPERELAYLRGEGEDPWPASR